VRLAETEVVQHRVELVGLVEVNYLLGDAGKILADPVSGRRFFLPSFVSLRARVPRPA
jgi:hypothetical protein